VEIEATQDFRQAAHHENVGDLLLPFFRLAQCHEPVREQPLALPQAATNYLVLLATGGHVRLLQSNRMPSANVSS
jgi:hypothetical protein